MQVLVGEHAVGNSEMCRPPPKDLSKPNGALYDSCVDSVRNPKIFVTFQISHAYPMYLLEYDDKDGDITREEEECNDVI